MSNCDDFQKQVSRAVLGDISSEEQESLELHLRDCALCRREWDRTVDVVSRLRLATDVAVPRHFFVHTEEGTRTAWNLLRAPAMAWKLGFAALLLGIALPALFAAANFHARIDHGAYVLSFGRQIDLKPQGSTPLVDVRPLKAELLRVLDERLRQERLHWIQAIKTEQSRSAPALSRRQQAELARVLASLEQRVNERIVTTSAALQTRWDKSLSDTYDSVQVQRQRDVMLALQRLDQLRKQEEVKASETDAILETLLQVAEVRLR